MSRGLSQRRSRLLAIRKSRHRKDPARARVVTWDSLEPRTLLSTWYVNSSNTNQAATGSAANPYETIQGAINVAGSGDSILVETGSGYSEDDTVSVSNLSIEADTGQSPVLTSSTLDAGTGFTVAATGVTISGFMIQDFSRGVIVQSGSLTLNEDTIQDNKNSDDAGGGGVLIDGETTINDSTIDDNSANNGDGGGICLSGGELTITDSTIANNSTGDGGGGIYSGGNLTAVNDTIAYNSATFSSGAGGGLYVPGGEGTDALYNTIVAQNIDSTGADDIAGAGINSASSNNLVGIDESFGGTVAKTISHFLVGPANPGLDVLAPNGGPTDTIARSRR